MTADEGDESETGDGGRLGNVAEFVLDVCEFVLGLF